MDFSCSSNRRTFGGKGGVFFFALTSWQDPRGDRAVIWEAHGFYKMCDLRDILEWNFIVFLNLSCVKLSTVTCWSGTFNKLALPANVEFHWSGENWQDSTQIWTRKSLFEAVYWIRFWKSLFKGRFVIHRSFNNQKTIFQRFFSTHLSLQMRRNTVLARPIQCCAHSASWSILKTGHQLVCPTENF